MVDYEARIATLEEDNKQHKLEHKEIFKRLNDKDIADAIMREQLDTVVKTTNRIEEKIDEQAKVPANRWNAIITAIATGVTGALLGALVSLVLK